MSRPILDARFIEVDDLPDGVDLVAELVAHNAVAREVVSGWVLTTGSSAGLSSDDYHSLTIMVDGERGALAWATDTGDLVPVDGTGSEEPHCRLAGWEDLYLPSGSVVPVEVVYAAVGEFVRTRGLPGCVEWRERPVVRG